MEELCLLKNTFFFFLIIFTFVFQLKTISQNSGGNTQYTNEDVFFLNGKKPWSIKQGVVFIKYKTDIKLEDIEYFEKMQSLKISPEEFNKRKEIKEIKDKPHHLKYPVVYDINGAKITSKIIDKITEEDENNIIEYVSPLFARDKLTAIITNEIIIRFKKEVNHEEADNILKKYKLVLIEVLPSGSYLTKTMHKSFLDQLNTKRSLSDENIIEFSDLNFIIGGLLLQHFPRSHAPRGNAWVNAPRSFRSFSSHSFQRQYTFHSGVIPRA